LWLYGVYRRMTNGNGENGDEATERKPPIQKKTQTLAIGDPPVIFDRHSLKTDDTQLNYPRKLIVRYGGSEDADTPLKCPEVYDSSYPCGQWPNKRDWCDKFCVYNGDCPGGELGKRCIGTLIKVCDQGYGYCWFANTTAWCTGTSSPLCWCHYSYVYDNCQDEPH